MWCLPKLKPEFCCRMSGRLTSLFQRSCYDMSGLFVNLMSHKNSSMACGMNCNDSWQFPPNAFSPPLFQSELTEQHQIWLTFCRGGTQTNSLEGVLPRPQIFRDYPTFVFDVLEAFTFCILYSVAQLVVNHGRLHGVTKASLQNLIDISAQEQNFS